MVKLFTEKLCEIELRADKMTTLGATAFIEHENEKKIEFY